MEPPVEHNKWNLASFINKATAQTTPVQQPQPQSAADLPLQPDTMTNIKNEPISLIEDEPNSPYPSQNSLPAYNNQNNKIVFEPKSNSLNSFDMSMEQIKQEPIGE